MLDCGTAREEKVKSQELFQIAKSVGPKPDRSQSVLEEGDPDGCFEHISSFMNSQRLLELEDNGMVDLLMLKDTVDNVINDQDVVLFDKTVNDDAHVHDTHF